MLQIINIIPPETFTKIPSIIAAKAIFALLGNIPFKIDKNNPNIFIVECSVQQKDRIIKHAGKQYKELEKAFK